MSSISSSSHLSLNDEQSESRNIIPRRADDSRWRPRTVIDLENIDALIQGIQDAEPINASSSIYHPKGGDGPSTISIDSMDSNTTHRSHDQHGQSQAANNQSSSDINASAVNSDMLLGLPVPNPPSLTPTDSVNSQPKEKSVISSVSVSTPIQPLVTTNSHFGAESNTVVGSSTIYLTPRLIRELPSLPKTFFYMPQCIISPSDFVLFEFVFPRSHTPIGRRPQVPCHIYRVRTPYYYIEGAPPRYVVCPSSSKPKLFRSIEDLGPEICTQSANSPEDTGPRQHIHTKMEKVTYPLPRLGRPQVQWIFRYIKPFYVPGFQAVEYNEPATEMTWFKDVWTENKDRRWWREDRPCTTPTPIASEDIDENGRRRILITGSLSEAETEVFLGMFLFRIGDAERIARSQYWHRNGEKKRYRGFLQITSALNKLLELKPSAVKEPRTLPEPGSLPFSDTVSETVVGVA